MSFNLSRRGHECDANVRVSCAIRFSGASWRPSRRVNICDQSISGCDRGKDFQQLFCADMQRQYMFILSLISFFYPSFFPPCDPFPSLLSFPCPAPFSLTPPAGSGGRREEQRGSAPRGAKDVAFPSEHLQPPGVHPRCSPVPVEHQTLYHMSGNHGNGKTK